MAIHASLPMNNGPSQAQAAAFGSHLKSRFQKAIISGIQLPAGSKPDDFEAMALAFTPAQLEIFAVTKLDRSAWATYTFTFPNLRFARYDRLRMTWQAIASCNPVLRTVLGVDALESQNMHQMVLRKAIAMRFCDEEPQGIKAPYLVYKEDENGPSTLSLHIHPALIDESSIDKLKDDFQLFYDGYSFSFRESFQFYVRSIHQRDQEEALEYWRKEFESYRAKPLFNSSIQGSSEETEVTVINSVPELSTRFSTFENEHNGLSESLLQGAWAVVLSRHLDVEDVAFNTTYRDSQDEGSDNIIGFLEVGATLRVDVRPEKRVLELLHTVQETAEQAQRFGYIGRRKRENVSPSIKDVQTSIRQVFGSKLLSTHRHRTSDIDVELDLVSSQILAFHNSSIPRAKVQLILEHFLEVLNQMLLDPQVPVKGITLVSSEEEKQLIEIGRAKMNVAPRLVHELIQEQCRTRADRPAVHFLNSEPVSYSQLNSMANRVARQLAKLIATGDFVAVHMGVSTKLIVSLLAILKAGGAYTILDPAHPKDRKSFILTDANAKLCLVDDQYQADLSEMDIDARVMSIDHLLSGPEEDTNLEISIDIESPAYIIHTSGSTGHPKGVVLSHQAVSSGILCALDLPSFRSLLFYNPIFSAAQRTLLSTIAHGGCLCLASGPDLQLHLAQTINSLQVNNLGITSSTISLIDPANVPSLRRITITGEAMDPDLIGRWADQVELRNNYGLSECTQLNWGAVLSRTRPNPRAIGRASDTTSAYVLQRDKTQLAPFLVPGELCLGGPQLTSGYLNRPDLTANVFIQSPFSQNERLYRTGDLAVRLEDGTIEIIGRKDFQVKINGQRVEPGEVQSVLRTHESIEAIAVLGATIEGRKYLVSCIVPKVGWVWSSLVLKLRALAAAKLPTYMVPSYWVEVPFLPVNRNGKTDLTSLRWAVEQKSRAELVGTSISPDVSNNRELTEMESALQVAYAGALNLPPDMVDMNSSFLAFGGDSLRAINVISELLERGYSLGIADILLSESLSKTAMSMKKAGEETIAPPKPFSLLPKGDNIDLSDYEDVFPATPLQESVVSAHILNGTYVYDRIFQIRGIDIPRLKAAFDIVVQENPIYRTTFLEAGTSYLQGIIKNFTLPWQEYRGMSLADVQQQTSEERMDLLHPFVKVIQLDESILIIRIHHALFDFWSSKFLFDDVAAAYLDQTRPTRPPFTSFVREVLDLDEVEANAFWSSHLRDAPMTKLEITTGVAFNAASIDLDIDLRVLSGASGLTLGALAYAAWALILWKHTGNQDVTFGITLSGRDLKIRGIQHLNGPTLTTIPLTIHVDPSITLFDFANKIQRSMWEAAKYSQYGMRKALHVSGHHLSPFDTMVNYLVKNDLDVDTEKIFKQYGERPVWITGLTTLELEELRNGALELRLSGQLEPIRTKFILEQVARVLTNLAQDSATKLQNVDFVSPSEEEFLQTLSTAAQPDPMLLHQPFESITALHPHRVAIESETREIVTYSELNARANGMARRLIEHGVGPDVLVPICLGKSIDTIVCILAVLKAGGAFVPLDPDNPPERNNFIVNDVTASIVLTDENYAPIFATQSDKISILDIHDLDVFGSSDANVEAQGLTPNHLAYAIYTSGSTGLPKGVLIPHRSISAGIDSIIDAEGCEQSWRNLQFSNYVFDVAIGDIFCTFGVGATLCVASVERMLADLAGVVNSMQVTRLFLTPTVARLLSPEDVPGVQGIYLAGEPVTPDLVETWTSHCTVMNCYGPTEASILTVIGQIKKGGNARIIGQPLKNTSGLILDPKSQSIVPYGAIGELCLGGSQLAREYLNRPDATQDAFITRDGQRLYRTGDLARWMPEGKIECFGRKDSQVKINGHRIEIGEIESAILGTGLVHDAAVVVIEVTGKSQLIAICVVEPSREQNSELLTYLHRETLALLSISLTTLAPYMIPQIFFPVGALPRLPSGKTDRKTLVKQAQEMGDELQRYSNGDKGSSEIHNAVTPEQILLQTIWGNLFARDPKTISITSAFFSLGGDSISAINLVGKCRGAGYLLTVSDVLAYPLLQDMATRMRSMMAKGEVHVAPILQASDKLQHELSDAGIESQAIQSIWPVVPGIEEFLIRGAEEEQFWQCQTVRRVPSDFDFELWKHLTTELTARNDILRSLWVLDGTHWLQIVLSDAIIDVEVLECDTEEEGKALIAQSWASRFDVAEGKPFVKYRLLEVRSTGTRDLLIKIHHAMYDGTLLRILDDQFQALHRGQELPRSVEFAEYVGYVSSTAVHKAQSLDFWIQLLAHSPPPYPPGPARHNANATGTILETVDSRVNAFAGQCGVTVPIVFQTAFTLLLAKLSGSSDVTYDNLITGRNIDMEDAQTINGNCANFLPFRSTMAPETTVRDLLKSTQSLFWQTTEYGAVNTTNIYEALGKTRETAASRALFLFQPFEPVTGSVKHMRWMVMAGSSVQMPIDYALHLEVSRTSSGYRLKFKYDEKVYSPSTAKGISQATVELLQGMMAKSFSAAHLLL